MLATCLLFFLRILLVFLAVRFCVGHNSIKPSELGGPNNGVHSTGV